MRIDLRFVPAGPQHLSLHFINRHHKADDKRELFKLRKFGISGYLL